MCVSYLSWFGHQIPMERHLGSKAKAWYNISERSFYHKKWSFGNSLLYNGRWRLGYIYRTHLVSAIPRGFNGVLGSPRFGAILRPIVCAKLLSALMRKSLREHVLVGMISREFMGPNCAKPNRWVGVDMTLMFGLWMFMILITSYNYIPMHITIYPYTS